MSRIDFMIAVSCPFLPRKATLMSFSWFISPASWAALICFSASCLMFKSFSFIFPDSYETHTLLSLKLGLAVFSGKSEDCAVTKRKPFYNYVKGTKIRGTTLIPPQNAWLSSCLTCMVRHLLLSFQRCSSCVKINRHLNLILLPAPGSDLSVGRCPVFIAIDAFLTYSNIRKMLVNICACHFLGFMLR